MEDLKILLVEDNEGDIILLQEAFARIGQLSFDVAEDGQQALDMLYNKPGYENYAQPDIILLDLNLPKETGYNILRKIKSDTALKSIPAIVFTSSQAANDVNACYALGANCYITKPFDFNKLVELMKNVLQYWSDIVFLPNYSDKAVA